jgi:thiol-disulfide isomerase/thioredoxin
MMRTVAALFLMFGLALQGAAPVPRPVGEFVKALDTSGQPISPAAYKGKVVVVQFLYTWCPHCQETARMLSKLQGEWGSQGLQVIGVAFNDEVNTKNVVANNAELMKFKAHATFPVGIASKEAAIKYLGISVMESFGVPQLIIIDRKGMIQGQTEAKPTGAWLAEPNLRAKIAKILAEK